MRSDLGYAEKRCGVIRVELGGTEAAAHDKLIGPATNSWAGITESGTYPSVWFLIHVAPGEMTFNA